MAHPDHARWKAGWRANEIPFHLSHVQPLLTRCWGELGLLAQDRVFVPLCGKSLDVMWLHQQGHPVVGVELSPVALGALFKAAHLRPRRQTEGALVGWRAPGLELFGGDFFALTAAQMAGVRAVYDRAALTALPEDLREAYVAHLHDILPGDCQMLLLTVEDLDDHENASASMGQCEEIVALYAGYFAIELLRAEYHGAAPDGLTSAGAVRCIHKAYRLGRLSRSAPVPDRQRFG